MAQFILLYVFQPLLSISARAELHTRCMLCDTVGATPCGCPLCKYIILRQNLVLNLLPKAHIPPALSALASVSDGRIIATAAVKQAFAECIIKSQCLFRADNICPYGWRMHAAFDVVGAAVYVVQYPYMIYDTAVRSSVLPCVIPFRAPTRGRPYAVLNIMCHLIL